MNAQRSTRRHLTVRDLPAEVADALEDEKRRRGTSLNRTVIDLLAQGLGGAPPAGAATGWRRLAGTWSAADLARFEEAIAPAEGIDEELWR